MLDLEALVGAETERVENTRCFGTDSCIARLAGYEAHLADGRVRAEAAHANFLIAAAHENTDAAIEDEVESVCGVALPRDNIAGCDLDAGTLLDQEIGVLGIAERLGQPLMERPGFATAALRGLYDGVFADFQRLVEVRHEQDVVSQEAAGAEGSPQVGGEIDEDEAGAALISCAFDLGKAVRGGGIDAVREAKVEHQKAAFRMARKQCLDMLV